MNISNLKYFAQGKRSIIYVKKLNSSIIAYKVVKDPKRTKNVIKNEYNFLKILNKHNIGPKVIAKGPNYVSYVFVKGVPLIEFIKNSSNKSTRMVIKNIMKQCYTMDKLGIVKEELHHPIKHILVGKKVVLIDFERAHYSNKPKNLTQFCQFLMNKNFKDILSKKGFNIDNERIILLMKDYKYNINKKNYDRLLKTI